jgi:hypothetical protein
LAGVGKLVGEGADGVELTPESRSEGFDAIGRGSFGGRYGFELGDALKEKALQRCHVLASQRGAVV